CASGGYFFGDGYYTGPFDSW
nr:immunoglobulin heavy chain junction region [Macaca mulatta]MOW93402.1 immunoglobulin heavy chain junction region [Macaca mulatta]MOW93433.1 immunoglobulin heavy chain junction region [Macaca mulatta]MOW93473.1 immunoglobulin heavy chain junction region [Macaca mulatta]MOW93616.1 immunoglobulin heavy chain junction region [Macaca mulatta]